MRVENVGLTLGVLVHEVSSLLLVFAQRLSDSTKVSLNKMLWGTWFVRMDNVFANLWHVIIDALKSQNRSQLEVCEMVLEDSSDWLYLTIQSQLNTLGVFHSFLNLFIGDLILDYQIIELWIIKNDKSLNGKRVLYYFFRIINDGRSIWATIVSIIDTIKNWN